MIGLGYGYHRTGRAPLRTPLEAKKELALPVYALLLGRASTVYPGTSLAGPSRVVGIFKNPGSGGDISLVGVLPVWVDGVQWQQGVLPVLKDPRWSPQRLVWLKFLGTDPWRPVGYIGTALEESFVQAGYGPRVP